jgi:polyphosphate glucokinase
LKVQYEKGIEKMEILGIDIGGSGIKGAVVDTEKGELVSLRHRLPIPPLAGMHEMTEIIERVVNHFEYSGAVGYGFPGVVIDGVIHTAANVGKDWIDVSAESLLTEKTGKPAAFLNDADAAGIAEMTFGAGKDQKGVTLMLTLGTGIGSAIFVDGKLVPNTEFGHLIIRGKDAEKRASDAARKERAMGWKKYGKRLQEYLTYMEDLFWPSLIILGGGGSKHAKKIARRVQTRATMVPAKMLNQAGIIGAAVYAFQRFHES